MILKKRTLFLGEFKLKSLNRFKFICNKIFVNYKLVLPLFKNENIRGHQRITEV